MKLYTIIYCYDPGARIDDGTFEEAADVVDKDVPDLTYAMSRVFGAVRTITEECAEITAEHYWQILSVENRGEPELVVSVRLSPTVKK